MNDTQQLKSMHLWPMIESSEADGVPLWVAQALLNDIKQLEQSIKILYQTDGSKLDAYALGFNNGYDFAEGLSNERIAELEQQLAEKRTIRVVTMPDFEIDLGDDNDE